VGFAECKSSRQIASQMRQTILQNGVEQITVLLLALRKTKDLSPIVPMARLMPMVRLYENKTPTH
jgi:hypothetical protein